MYFFINDTTPPPHNLGAGEKKKKKKLVYVLLLFIDIHGPIFYYYFSHVVFHRFPVFFVDVFYYACLLHRRLRAVISFSLGLILYIL